MHKCINNSIGNVYHLEQFVSDFFPYSQKQLGFDKPATIRFESDQDNAGVMLGKTAYYDPESMEVVLYIDGRHPKDVMRSLSHELVHHAQNCRGDFTGQNITGPGYAQSDPHLRKMEREAYTKGNLIFRDFEDLIKTGKINIEIDFSDSGEPKMSLKEWKNNEINTKLMKKWGFLKEDKSKELEHPPEGPGDPGYKEKPAPGSKEYEELNEDSKEEESENMRGRKTKEIEDVEDEKGLEEGAWSSRASKRKELADRPEFTPGGVPKAGDPGLDPPEAGLGNVGPGGDEVHVKGKLRAKGGDNKPAKIKLEAEVDEAKRHVYGADSELADFIMPNKPKGKAPEPGTRVWDPRHLKDKTTKVAPVAVPGDDELDTRTRHLNRTKDGKLVPAVRDPEHPDAIKRENKKISVREAKQITRRIIERIKKEGK